MTASPDKARMIDRLEKLVGINTENPPGHEAQAAAYLAGEMKALGFEVELRELQPGRSNVIARYINGPGPVFAFNSHLDVVPAGDGWSTAPFKLTDKGDGRLYGRGSCDAKGPIVAMVEAGRLLLAEKGKWSGELLLVFVFDEEIGSAGAKEYAKTRPHVNFAVIGEPTLNKVAAAHKGAIRPYIRVNGQMAHSGTPELGVNAAIKATHLLQMFDEYHHKVLLKREHPLVGKASLTITRLIAGLGDNIVPPSCEFLVDRRMIPGEGHDQALKEIQDIMARAKEQFDVDSEIVEFKPTSGPASETPLDDAVVRESMAAAEAITGEKHDPVGLSGGCDLVHFRSIGASGVVMGPGSLAVAHKPNEFIPINEFIDASLIYRDTVLRLLHEVGATR
ncbi:MAG: M20 family peptidase [Rhodospirillales bacterium]|nr:M20 family peptidase [Rhodospirillales bacterium]